jgi:uncharacterized protein YecE (DUF72 family)
LTLYLAIDLLGEKLGPLLLQFGYFNKAAFPGVNDFLVRLRPFLKKLPKDHKFALEIRNKNWLVPQFLDALQTIVNLRVRLRHLQHFSLTFIYLRIHTARRPRKR